MVERLGSSRSRDLTEGESARRTVTRSTTFKGKSHGLWRNASPTFVSRSPFRFLARMIRLDAILTCRIDRVDSGLTMGADRLCANAGVMGGSRTVGAGRHEGEASQKSRSVQPLCFCVPVGPHAVL